MSMPMMATPRKKSKLNTRFIIFDLDYSTIDLALVLIMMTLATGWCQIYHKKVHSKYELERAREMVHCWKCSLIISNSSGVLNAMTSFELAKGTTTISFPASTRICIISVKYSSFCALFEVMCSMYSYQVSALAKYIDTLTYFVFWRSSSAS